ncbi:hypothetical protein E4U09_007648, partial [Claviceps aff. purpurea]
MSQDTVDAPASEMMKAHANQSRQVSQDRQPEVDQTFVDPNLYLDNTTILGTPLSPEGGISARDSSQTPSEDSEISGEGSRPDYEMPEETNAREHVPNTSISTSPPREPERSSRNIPAWLTGDERQG